MAPFPIQIRSVMRIKYEVSAGGLLLRRRDSTYDALLIGRGAPPRVWTLPKGHVEHRESTEQAALARGPRGDGLLGRDRHAAQRDRVLVLRREGQAPQVRHVLPDALPLGRSGEPRSRSRRRALVRRGAGAQDAQIRQRKALVDLALEFLAENPDAFGEPAVAAQTSLSS